MECSPLLKYRGVARVDQSTGRWYYVGLVLRQSGRVEIYADFILVDEFLDPCNQCVDIEIDQRKFYLRTCKDSHLVTRDMRSEALVTEMHRVRFNWRNQIGRTTIKPLLDQTWNESLQLRVSRYVRLYSQVINFSTFMLVAHRNLISVFDMSKPVLNGSESCWTDTLRLSRSPIRNMFVKTRPKDELHGQLHRRESLQRLNGLNPAGTSRIIRTNSIVFNAAKPKPITLIEKFEIVCLVGTHTFAFTRVLSVNGQPKFDRKVETLKSKGRVLNVVNDKLFGFGIFCLTDTGEEAFPYNTQLDCSLYSFAESKPPGPGSSGEIQLVGLKKREFFPLLSSNEEEAQGCLTA